MALPLTLSKGASLSIRLTSTRSVELFPAKSVARNQTVPFSLTVTLLPEIQVILSKLYSQAASSSAEAIRTTSSTVQSTALPLTVITGAIRSIPVIFMVSQETFPALSVTLNQTVPFSLTVTLLPETQVMLSKLYSTPATPLISSRASTDNTISSLVQPGLPFISRTGASLSIRLTSTVTSETLPALSEARKYTS